MSKTQNGIQLRPIIRIFVSSTFSDLRRERDALQQLVFPKMEQLCLKEGFQFQVIDLRWGVSSEAGLDHRTMRICFEELRRSQEISPEPNFLILLGNRYGWCPLPEAISQSEFDRLVAAAKSGGDIQRPITGTHGKTAEQVLREWYRRDDNVLVPTPPITDVDREKLNNILQPRTRNLGDGRDYTRTMYPQPRDTQDWLDVQQVLWSIINAAFASEDYGHRFDRIDWPRHYDDVHDEQHPKRAIPQIVRFQGSATEQEIWCGALSEPNASQHVLAFFRDINPPSSMTDTQALGEFFDLKSGKIDPLLQSAQNNLKDVVRRRLGKNAVDLPCARLTVNVDQSVSISTDHLDQLCREVEMRLTAIIERRIEKYSSGSQSSGVAIGVSSSGLQIARELDIERNEHLSFGLERGPKKSFVGRQDHLDKIRDYLENDSRLPLVIHGASGCGKTALLARAFQEIADEKRPMVRFIGVTPRSSDLRSLLSFLCLDMRHRHARVGKVWGSPVPTDFNDLKDEFQSHLESASPEQPVILLLDALDQLSEADNDPKLYWIPANLPSGAKIVVSCLSDRVKDDPAGMPIVEFKRRTLIDINGISLEPLSVDDAKELLFDRWLLQADRTLGLDQRHSIELRLESDMCRQPLFLKLLFEEACLWHSYDPPIDIGDGVPALLEQLFARLGRPENHGDSLVKHFLGYIAAARRGLSESEIQEVLFYDPDYKSQLDRVSQLHEHQLPADPCRIPFAIWSRLRSDLAPYLSERAAPGGNVLTLYHRQVAERVKARFVDQSIWNTHERLAGYFARQKYRFEPVEQHLHHKTLEDSHWILNVRKLDELIWQHLQSQQFDLAGNLLQDLDFLTAKINAGLVTDLLDEYSQVQRNATTPHSLDAWHGFLQTNTSVFREHPELVFQQACNEAKDSPVSLAAWERWERRADSKSAFMLPVTFLEWTNRPENWFPSACRQILAGHQQAINSVAISGNPNSADGYTVISGASDNTVKIWDARTGECRRTINGYSGAGGSVAISKNGKTLAFTCVGHAIAVWNVQTGVCQWTLSEDHGAVGGIALSEDGTTLASGGADNMVRVWDIRTGEPVWTRKGRTARVSGVAVSGDGVTLVTESYHRISTIKVWNVLSESCRDLTVTGPQDSVCGMAISADGSTLATGSRNKTINVWDIQSGECRKVLSGHADVVLCVALSPDGSTLASGSMDKTIRVWDIPSGECRKVYTGETDWITCLAMSEDGQLLVSGTADKTVKVWDIQNGVCRPLLSRHAEPVICQDISADRTTLATGSKDWTIRVWDVQTGACRPTLRGHRFDILSVALSTDGSTLVSASKDATIKVWDIASGVCLQTLVEHKGEVRSVLMSTDGTRIFSGGCDRTIKVWDAISGACLQTVNAHPNGSVMSIAMSGDEATLFSASSDRTIKEWNVGTWECKNTLSGNQKDVRRIALTEDGTTLVSIAGSGDSSLMVWDIRTGKCEESVAQDSDEGRAAMARVVRGHCHAWRFQSKIGYLEFTLTSDNPTVPHLLFPGVFGIVKGDAEGRHVLAFSRSGEGWHFRRHDRDDFTVSHPSTTDAQGATCQNA